MPLRICRDRRNLLDEHVLPGSNRIHSFRVQRSAGVGGGLQSTNEGVGAFVHDAPGIISPRGWPA